MDVAQAVAVKKTYKNDRHFAENGAILVMFQD
jgi:hypothetical protein